MENPLDKFRRNAGSPSNAGKILTGPGPTPYEAYKASNKRQFRLKIRPAIRAWERMTYGYLTHIVEDGIYGTELALVFTFSVVVMKGRNLQQIAEAIDAETCEFIQQFDPDRWTEPTDPKAPFISEITIHVQAGMVKASDKVLADIEHTRQNPPV